MVLWGIKIAWLLLVMVMVMVMMMVMVMVKFTAIMIQFLNCRIKLCFL